MCVSKPRPYTNISVASFSSLAYSLAFCVTFHVWQLGSVDDVITAVAVPTVKPVHIARTELNWTRVTRSAYLSHLWFSVKI